MDIGMYYGTPYVIEELEDLGIDHVTLYFSHLHMDHIGSSGSWNLTDGLEEFAESGITIDKLYLPAESLSPRSKSNPRRYEILRKYAEGKFPIEYLKVGDELKVGDATGKSSDRLMSTVCLCIMHRARLPMDCMRITVAW